MIVPIRLPLRRLVLALALEKPLRWLGMLQLVLGLLAAILMMSREQVHSIRGVEQPAGWGTRAHVARGVT